MPSGFGRSTSAPASSIVFTQPRHPARAAYSSGVRPPVGRYCTRGSLLICVGQSVDRARIDRSAPFDTRNATISAWFSPAAHITADWSLNCSRRLTSAPCFTSSSATATSAGTRCQHQRRLPVLVGDVGVGAGFEQHPDERHVGDTGRFSQRARAIVVDDVGLGAFLQQPLHQLLIDAVRGPVQRRCSVRLRAVHVDAAGRSSPAPRAGRRTESRSARVDPCRFARAGGARRRARTSIRDATAIRLHDIGIQLVVVRPQPFLDVVEELLRILPRPRPVPS